MSNWKLIAGVRGRGHRLYLNDRTLELAVTDDSQRRVDDPTSTDDGLLLVDSRRCVEVSGTGVTIPVRAVNQNGREGHVCGSLFGDLPLAVMCRNHGLTVNLADSIARLAAQLQVLAGPTDNPLRFDELVARGLNTPTYISHRGH